MQRIEGPITPDGWPRGAGFSHAIVSPPGRVVHIAGVASLDPVTGKPLWAGDFIKQWEQILDNIRVVLRAAGAKPEHVGAMRLYVTDRDAYMAARVAMGRAFRKRFGQHYPAMTLIGVLKLFADEFMLEVETEAVIPLADKTNS
jgi:enamine deaminase RidA (YjgF/YER057c/UK114 family)